MHVVIMHPNAQSGNASIVSVVVLPRRNIHAALVHELVATNTLCRVLVHNGGQVDSVACHSSKHPSALITSYSLSPFACPGGSLAMSYKPLVAAVAGATTAMFSGIPAPSAWRTAACASRRASACGAPRRTSSQNGNVAYRSLRFRRARSRRAAMCSIRAASRVR
jgi:hypothetical protein